MKHFVSYHNADKMGYAYEDANPFSVGTTKSVERLIGNRVWSISGDGKPRTYRLRDTYLVDRTGLSGQNEFVSFARGSTGIVFDPPVVLNPLPWFSAFLKSQSIFSLGLQQIKDEFVSHLEALRQDLRGDGSTATFPDESTTTFPDEVDPEATYREGAVVKVTVNAYERNSEARRRCIKHYGSNCSICGFNFGNAYGPTVEGLIHVHHLRPLSEVGVEYEVDPVTDLRPFVRIAMRYCTPVSLHTVSRKLCASCVCRATPNNKSATSWELMSYASDSSIARVLERLAFRLPRVEDLVPIPSL